MKLCNCLALENKLWETEDWKLGRGEHDVLGTMVDVFCWLVVVAGEGGGTGVGAIIVLSWSLDDVEGCVSIPVTQEKCLACAACCDVFSACSCIVILVDNSWLEPRFSVLNFITQLQTCMTIFRMKNPARFEAMPMPLKCYCCTLLLCIQTYHWSSCWHQFFYIGCWRYQHHCNTGSITLAW